MAVPAQQLAAVCGERGRYGYAVCPVPDTSDRGIPDLLWGSVVAAKLENAVPVERSGLGRKQSETFELQVRVDASARAGERGRCLLFF